MTADDIKSKKRLIAKILASSAAAVLTGFSPAAVLAEPVSEKNLPDFMLLQARENVADIVSGAGTLSGSKYLKDTEAIFNVRLKNQGGSAFHSRIFYADPAKFESAFALGLSPEASTAALLKDAAIPVDQNTLVQLTRSLANASVNPLTNSAFSATEPRVTIANGKRGDVCIVTPATEYTDQFHDILILRHIMFDFVNHHEGWHCLDNRYRGLMDALFKGYEEEMSRKPLPDVLASAKAQEYIALALRIESFADMGAAGDMIIKGQPLEILDRIAVARSGLNQVDLIHTSSPFLQVLKERIADIGIDRFKKMDTSDLSKLYYGILDETAPSGKQIGILLAYGNSNEAGKKALKAAAASDPEVHKALDYHHRFSSEAQSATHIPLFTTEQMNGFKVIVEEYDAGKALLDTAYLHHGIITPKSLIRAHEELQDQMRAAMREDPLNPIYPAMAGKLKKTIIDELPRLDFSAANRLYGVTSENSVELKAAANKPPAGPRP